MRKERRVREGLCVSIGHSSSIRLHVLWHKCFKDARQCGVKGYREYAFCLCLSPISKTIATRTTKGQKEIVPSQSVHLLCLPESHSLLPIQGMNQTLSGATHIVLKCSQRFIFEAYRMESMACSCCVYAFVQMGLLFWMLMLADKAHNCVKDSAPSMGVWILCSLNGHFVSMVFGLMAGMVFWI